MHLEIPVTAPMLRGACLILTGVTIINGGLGLRVMLAGGKEYLKQFEDFIGEYPKHYEYRKTFTCVYYSAYKSVLRIRELMYKGVTIYLKRKYARFYEPVKYRVN